MSAGWTASLMVSEDFGPARWVHAHDEPKSFLSRLEALNDEAARNRASRVGFSVAALVRFDRKES
jgi:hypothetical protein